MNTKKLFDGLDIRVETREHMISALASKGKWSGYLCATRPKDPDRAAAWLAIMSNICPQRASVGSIFMLGRERRVFDEVDRICRLIPGFILAAEPFFRWQIDSAHVESCRWAWETNPDVALDAINGGLKRVGVR